MLPDLDVNASKGSFHMGTEDILAIGAVIVAVIIAYGILIKTLDVTAGGTIITALVGSAGIAQVVKSRRRPKKESHRESRP